jgi:5-methylcytosine-specific restriction enzyme subunit McrC
MAPFLIRKFEHQKLKVGDKFEFGEFTLTHFEALAKYQEREESPYYKLGHQSVTFTEFVGVIKVGPLTIEVLPKADKPTGKESDTDKAVWQKVLIDMLRKVNGFDIQVTSDASLKLKPNAILHFYFEMFVKEVELLIHQGLVKRYRKEEDNQNALKGSLQFAQHIQKNLTHQERFYVRYTTYDRNNPYNRVLLKTLKVLENLNTSPLLQSRISSLILNFPELPDIAVSAAFFEKLVINRKTEGYRKALQISKLILLNYHPDLSKGRNDVLALMFDMNKLWEQYILVCLRRAGSQESVIVKGQSVKGFWKPAEGYTKTIRPDIFLQKGSLRIVVDTKWKRPERGKPDDGDLKQLFVYNLFWKSQMSYLVYPGEPNLIKGDFHDHTQDNNPLIINKNCTAQTWVSVLEGKNLNPKIGIGLLELFGLIDKKFQF